MAETRRYKVTYVDYAFADSADEAVDIVRASIVDGEVSLVDLCEVEECPEPEQYEDDIPY